MNKEKIGKFLRKLREEKGWSQEYLGNLFNQNYFQVSTKAISDWETGKSIPEIEKLSLLSQIYEVSIDEIMDGARYSTKDFYEEYVFARKDWQQLFVGKYDIYETHQEHKIKVIKRFKELLIKKIKGGINRNEEDEFKFLFEHFYKLSDYADKYVNSNVSDNYLRLDEAIKNKLKDFKLASNEEKYFEVSKFIVPTDETDFKLNEILVDPLKDSYIDKRFKMLDWWEKDMLLMSIQQGKLPIFDPSTCGAKNLERYENQHGKEFDKNEYVRNAIRYMIENGAHLNYQFINIISKKKVRERIIDKIEELYLLCKKPVECSYQENAKSFTYYYENTPKNRFIAKHFYLISAELKDILNFDIDGLYEFVWKYDPDNLPNELIIDFAKKLHIDVNRDFKYILSDFNMHSYILMDWKKYRKEEKQIEEGLKKLEKLEKLLNKGEVYIITEKEEYIGGKDFKTMMSYFYFWLSDNRLSLDELKKMQNRKLTKQLLENLDSYTLEDIRNIYFKEEIREDTNNE